MTEPPLTPVADLPQPRSQWLDVWDQFKTHRGALWGMGFFVTVLIAVLLGPYVWTIDAQYIDIRARNQGPSFAHPLGTDQLGRDVLAQAMEGGRISLSVGFAALTIIGFVGWPEPLISAFMQKGEPARVEILAVGVGLLAMAALFFLLLRK